MPFAKHTAIWTLAFMSVHLDNQVICDLFVGVAIDIERGDHDYYYGKEERMFYV